jgi:hypothetical protein
MVLIKYSCKSFSDGTNLTVTIFKRSGQNRRGNTAANSALD